VTLLRRTLAVTAAAAVAALGPAAARPTQAAESGRPGYCTDDAGVTVVVDFRELGGDVVVRCASGPGGQGFTGLEALTGAGLSVAGTQRWGMQFVCRIQGRPTAHEDLAIPGDDSYHEDCGDTPPDTAYWTYWYAPNGGSWRYSSISAASRSTIRGGFEGWSFHLGSAAPQPPPVAPRHAVAAPTSSPPEPTGGQDGSGGQSATSPPPAPTTSTADGPSTSASSPRRGQHDGKPDKPDRATTTEPARSAPATEQPSDRAGGPRIVTAVPEQPDDGGGSAIPFAVGAGVLALLGVGAGATAWRRSRRG
jgi:hypothetical protein